MSTYSGKFEEYLSEEELEEAQGVFDEYADKNYGDVEKDFKQAEYKLKDKTGLFSDEDKKKAKKVIKKLGRVIGPIEILESEKLGKIRENIEKKSRKAKLKALFKKEEE